MYLFLLSVHQLFCVGYCPSEGFTDGLMSKADTQDRQLVFEIFYGFNTDSRILRFSRTRRKDQCLRLHGLQLFDGHFIISYHFDIRLHRTDQLVNIVGKAIIIIDQYYHSSPSCAVSIACTTALALLQHS